MADSTWEKWSSFTGDNGPEPLVPLVLRPAKLPDPRSIRPREWLYGNDLIRGFVTVLVAPGGTGKTAYAMVVAAALASNRSLLGEKVFEQVNVAVLNLEDPMDELDRRLAAICLHYQIPTSDIDGRYFLHSGDDRRICAAQIDEDGVTVIHPDKDALIRELQVHDIGLLVVDPFAESHSLEENSNPHMILANAAWRTVARATGCAILLVHHVRKGTITDIDAARGAKATTDAARVGLLMAPMSEAEATDLFVEPTERHRYVRLDNAKANMAPRAAVARWLQLDQVELHNGAGRYPNGDKVAVIASWVPNRTAMDGMSVADCNAALNVIAAEFEPGIPYGASKQGGSGRWVGQVLVGRYGRTEAQAGGIVKSWINSGLLYEIDFKHPKTRQTGRGLAVNDDLRPGPCA